MVSTCLVSYNLLVVRTYLDVRLVQNLLRKLIYNNYSNVNQITSFGAAQPIYTDYNNTEVLFRKKRLTSSEEILTSIVKKMDDIADQFDGIKKSFPITVEGETVIVKARPVDDYS